MGRSYEEVQEQEEGRSKERLPQKVMSEPKNSEQNEHGETQFLFDFLES